MIRKLFIFSLIAAMTFNVDAAGFGARRSRLPAAVAAAACLSYVWGGIIYAAMDDQTKSDHADHIQLYEAVRLQQSWWLHRVVLGDCRQKLIFEKADKSGMPRSTLYKRALRFAEEIYDTKIADVLRKRLEDQEKADLPAVAPIATPIPPIEPKLEEQVKSPASGGAHLFWYPFLTTAAVGAGIAATLSQRKIIQLRDSEAHLNGQLAIRRQREQDLQNAVNAANGRERNLQAQLNQSHERAGNLQRQVNNLNDVNNRANAAIARLNQQLADGPDAELPAERDLLQERLNNALEREVANIAERANLQHRVDQLNARLQQQGNAQRQQPAPPLPPVPVPQAIRPADLEAQAGRLFARAGQERNVKYDGPKVECSLCNVDRPPLEVINLHPASAAGQQPHLACIDCLVGNFAQGRDNCPHCQTQLNDNMRQFIKLQFDVLAADQAARPAAQ